MERATHVVEQGSERFPGTGTRTDNSSARRVLGVWFGGCALAALLWLLYFAARRMHSAPVLHNMFPAGPRYEDLLVYGNRIKLFHTRAFFEPRAGLSTFAYPLPAALLYDGLFRTSHIRRVYLTLNMAAFAVVLTLAWTIFSGAVRSRTLQACLVTSLGLLSYPFVFLVQRGNIEMALCVFTALGLFAYSRRRPYPAAVLLGMAAALKPFPVVLLGLFLSRRSEARALLVGVATAVGVTLFCLWYAGPTVGIAARGSLAGVLGFGQTHVNGTENLRFDHSLLSPWKLAAQLAAVPLERVTRPYKVVAVLCFLLGFLRVRRFPLVNRVCFLAAISVSLAPISYEYTLVHLYVPVCLLMAALLGEAGEARPPGLGLLALGALLFTLLPLAPWRVGGVSFGGQLQAVALGVALLLAVARPWGVIAPAETPEPVLPGGVPA